MPNIAITYTPNLRGELDHEALVKRLHAAAQRLEVFPSWGVRVLATEASFGLVGAGDPDLGYIQVLLRVAPGRTTETKELIVRTLSDEVRTVATTISTRPVGFQVDLTEFDRTLTISGGNLPGSPTA